MSNTYGTEEYDTGRGRFADVVVRLFVFHPLTLADGEQKRWPNVFLSLDASLDSTPWRADEKRNHSSPSVAHQGGGCLSPASTARTRRAGGPS